MKDGTYKTKIVEDYELPTIKEKFLKSKAHEYWWVERIYGKRQTKITKLRDIASE